MAEVKEQITLEELVRHLNNTLISRKSFLKDAYAKATNPLDRLELKARIEELEFVLSHMEVK